MRLAGLLRTMTVGRVRLLHAWLFAPCACGLFAQPVIDSTAAPVAGSTYVYLVGDLLSLPGTGAGQVWDASMASTITTDTIAFIDTADASGAFGFPQADVARKALGRETFLRADADGLYELGYHVPDPGFTAVYSDQRQVMAWPCAVGTAWADTFSGSYMFQGEPYTIDGTASFEATGSGTLLLPGGAVEDVLRIDGTESYDEVGSGNTYSYSATFTLFLTPNAKLPVARNVQSTAVFNGVASNPVLRFQYLDAVSLASPGWARDAQLLPCWPNPAATLVHVTPPEAGEWTFRLIAPEGRVVRHLQAQVNAGAPFAIDLSGLSAGTYVLLAGDPDGRSWWQPLIVAP